MTTYQLIYLRYLRMCADFPELNHRGHAPSHVDNQGELLDELFNHNARGVGQFKEQRIHAAREFYRPIEQPLTGEGAPALETHSVSRYGPMPQAAPEMPAARDIRMALEAILEGSGQALETPEDVSMTTTTTP